MGLWDYGTVGDFSHCPIFSLSHYLIVSFLDYGTVGLWDCGRFFSLSHFLVVSLSHCLIFGLWDIGTMGLCDVAADKNSVPWVIVGSRG